MTLAQTLAAIAAALPQEIKDLPAQEFAVTFGTPWLETLATCDDRRND